MTVLRGSIALSAGVDYTCGKGSRVEMLLRDGIRGAAIGRQQSVGMVV